MMFRFTLFFVIIAVCFSILASATDTLYLDCDIGQLEYIEARLQDAILEIHQVVSQRRENEHGGVAYLSGMFAGVPEDVVGEAYLAALHDRTALTFACPTPRSELEQDCQEVYGESDSTGTDTRGVFLTFGTKELVFCPSAGAEEDLAMLNTAAIVAEIIKGKLDELSEGHEEL